MLERIMGFLNAFVTLDFQWQFAAPPPFFYYAEDMSSYYPEVHGIVYQCIFHFLFITFKYYR